MAGLVRVRGRARAAALALALTPVLAAALIGCGPAEDEVAGTWGGRLIVIHDDRQQVLPVTLRLERKGHTLTGEVRAETVAGERGDLPGRRFEIIEGLEADGRVFFHARALMAIGTASLVFDGAVESRDGSRRLSGEVHVDVATTEGQLQMPGRLEAEPVPEEGRDARGEEGSG